MSYARRRREVNGNSNRSSDDSIRSGSLSKSCILKNDRAEGYLRRPSWINGSSSGVASANSSAIMKGLLHSDHGATRMRTVGAKFSIQSSEDHICNELKEDHLCKKDKRRIDVKKTHSNDDDDSVDSPALSSENSSPTLCPALMLETKKNNVDKMFANSLKSADKKERKTEKEIHEERKGRDEKRRERSSSRSSSKPGPSSRKPRSKLVAMGPEQEPEVNYETDDSNNFIQTELAVVTETLDLIRETQENILAELKVDIESLQDENSTLLKSNEKLKNDNSKLQTRLMEFQFNLDRMSMNVKEVKKREERIQDSIKTKKMTKERKSPAIEESVDFSLQKHQSRKEHRTHHKKEDQNLANGEKDESVEDLFKSIKKREKSIKVDEEEVVVKKPIRKTVREHRSRSREETRKKSSTSLRESLIKIQRQRSLKSSGDKKSYLPSEEPKSPKNSQKKKKKKESTCLSFFGFRRRSNSEDEDEDTK